MTTARTFAIGSTVTTSPTVRPTRFAGRTGTVTARNLRDDEVGVALTGHGNVTWFRPTELETAVTSSVCPLEPLNGAASTQVAEVAA